MRRVYWRGHRPLRPGLGVVLRGQGSNIIYWGGLALLVAAGVYAARRAFGAAEDRGVPAAWEL